MTAQDLAAAKARVQQREQELADAQRSLAVAEHGEYKAALGLIGNAISDLPAELGGGDAGQATNAINAVRTVLSGLGFRA